MMKLLSLSFTLFLLMDSIGNVPIFISILKEINPKRQRYIIFRELCIALAIIILFYFVGDIVLSMLGVQQPAVMISGGIILFIIAIRMIFPQKKEPNGDQYNEEPLIVPLAVPLVAGPAVLAAVLLYSAQYSAWVIIPAIIIAWVASTVVLLSASFLKRILGNKGMLACEKLMGLILTMIAIQMLLGGISGFYKLCMTAQ